MRWDSIPELASREPLREADAELLEGRSVVPVPVGAGVPVERKSELMHED